MVARQVVRGSTRDAVVQAGQAIKVPYGGVSTKVAGPASDLRARLMRFNALLERADTAFRLAGAVRDRIVGFSDPPGAGQSNRPDAAANGPLLDELDVLLGTLDGLLEGAISRLQTLEGKIVD